MVKLVRKTSKIFGSTGSNLGQFGSAQTGSPVLKTELEDLQLLPAYEEGWTDAVISGSKRPPLEEFNSLKYINDYQTSYLFQEGLAEYDAGTRYFIGGFVKEVGTVDVYKSLVDDNIGVALSNATNWEFQGNFSSLKNVASNLINVNSEADFPAPIGGIITLEDGKNYQMNSVVVTANKFQLPSSGFCKISAAEASYALVYTGTEAMFNGTDFFLFITGQVVFQAPLGKLYDVSGFGSIFMIETLLSDIADAGDIQNANFAAFVCDIADFGEGFKFQDNTTQATFVNCSFYGWKNNANSVMINASGAIGLVSIDGSAFETNANETVFNLEQSLNTNQSRIICNTSDFGGIMNGAIFTPTSLDQTYNRSKFTGNAGIPDSTASIQVGFESGIEVTTINTIGIRELINAKWEAQLPEGLVMQDHLTFDSGSNTLTSRLVDNTTAYDHGLVDDDRFTLKVGINPVGTLPPELDEATNYFVVSSTLQTFQISLTQGGGAINFSTNGTGTNYFRHPKGINTASWIVYIGLDKVKISFNGATSFIAESGATDRTVFAEVAKIDTGNNSVDLGTSNLFGKGIETTINNSLVGNSPVHGLVELLTDESLRFFATNASSTTNLIATGSNISNIKG